jgi:DNA-binding FrmR family transcriptional regulator
MDSTNDTSCCGGVKLKHRDEKEYKRLISRLNRIEGQVRGIKRIDILMQVTAIQSALNSFNKELLGQHIKSCVVHDIREGKDDVVDELVCTLQKLMK